MPDSNSGRGYRPIDCSLHDRLEAAATLGRRVCLVFRTEDGAVEVIEDRIVDVFARDGEELLKTAAGRLIRLDRLQSVEGVAFTR